MKGIHREIQKLQASDVDKHILNSRITISEAEYHQSSAREQQAVLARWQYNIQSNYAKKQSRKDRFSEDILGLSPSAKAKGKDKDKDNDKDPKGYVRTSETEIVSPVPRHIAYAYAPGVLQRVASFKDEELEKAIQESVRATSNGDPEEDKTIEQAIRASVSEIQYVARNHPTENFDEEEEAFQQAVRASMTEANTNGEKEQEKRVGGKLGPSKELGEKRRAGGAGEYGTTVGGSWLTDDPEFEEALHKSLVEHGAPPGHVDDDNLQRVMRESSRYGGAHRPSDEDELEKALRESRRHQKSPESTTLPEEYDEDFLRAIEESKRLDQEKEAKRLAEEQVVMEYVMRASLEEQEYQMRRNQGSEWGSRA